MKKLLLLLLAGMTVFTVAACDRNDNDVDLDEVGNDLKRDMNRGADRVGDAVEDATD